MIMRRVGPPLAGDWKTSEKSASPELHLLPVRKELENFLNNEYVHLPNLPETIKHHKLNGNKNNNKSRLIFLLLSYFAFFTCHVIYVMNNNWNKTNKRKD